MLLALWLLKWLQPTRLHWVCCSKGRLREKEDKCFQDFMHRAYIFTLLHTDKRQWKFKQKKNGRTIPNTKVIDVMCWYWLFSCMCRWEICVYIEYLRCNRSIQGKKSKQLITCFPNYDYLPNLHVNDKNRDSISLSLLIKNYLRKNKLAFFVCESIYIEEFRNQICGKHKFNNGHDLVNLLEFRKATEVC